jgi:hypothetical protein
MLFVSFFFVCLVSAFAFCKPKICLTLCAAMISSRVRLFPLNHHHHLQLEWVMTMVIIMTMMMVMAMMRLMVMMMPQRRRRIFVTTACPSSNAWARLL